MESWSTAVLEWVNCLDILDTHINDLKELQDGKFYAKLIKILSETGFEDDEGDKDLVFRFIQDSYPEFLGQRKEDEKKCKEIHIASLLLLHSSQDPKLHRPMCIKLSNETQIKIKSFLEKVLNYGSCVTKDNINTAIMETGENLVRTPPVTPKMRPLKDFFNSPATTVRKNYNRIMDERTREVRSLKAELETERFEKADLQEDLELQRQKNNSLQQKLQEKIAEMKKMREDSTRLETPQSARKRKDVKTPRNRFDAKVRELTEEIEQLKAEIIDLQDEKQSLVRKLNSAERNCITFKERSKMNERNVETLLIQADLKDQEIKDLKNYNEELRTHIHEMRRQTIDEQSFEMEMTTMSSNGSLNGSEVLSSVIDIQLQEAKEESKIVRSQLEDLNQRLRSVEGEYQVLQHFNQTLEAEVNLLQSTKQELARAQKELSEYIKLSNTLEGEKLHFQEQAVKFEILVSEKENLLQQSAEHVETLKIQSHNLENKIEAAHDLLSKESTRVRDLEAVVSQKEDILKTECLRYNDLDKQHTKLQQEKLDLLEETNDLKNMVSSQEESLKQAQQQRETLELNLRNLRSELKTIQDLLSSEKTTNKDLESTISKMKSEHENIRQLQMLRYQALEERYVNLEQEKDGLLQETKYLNLKIVTTENLLQQSFEKNENFASDLRDVKEKLQNTKHALTEERKKVQDLESRVRQIETDKREFVELQSAKYQTLKEEHVNLEREKSRLAKDIENLSNVISAKEQLLKQSSDERENLESIIRELDEKLLTVQNSLSEERTRVKDLEIIVTHIKQEKEKALQSQLMSYQALEKIHMNVKQEKMNLLTESDRLKNLISSKEELLEQIQQQNGKLDLDLRDLNKNLQTVQDLLSRERTRVEDLESTVSRMKLEHEETLKGQTLRYKDLEEKYVNLESEKANLLEETKTLNQRIADIEDVITQSQQEKEKLLSDLRDLNLKFQTLQDSLAEERSKVATLESAVTHIKQEKEEILKQQSVNYQALEKKHTDLEQQKLELLEDTENLQNLFSSREEQLHQSQQHVTKLELDLCAMKDEMKTVQNELHTAKTKIESLESALTQTKLETEKIMQSNKSLQSEICSLESTKHDLYEVKEQLQKQSEELEREKSCLLAAIEDLKTDASLKEELLKQTQQWNESLHSQLNDLNEEIKSVRSLLSVKSTRVEDLESKIAQINQEKEENLQRQLMSYHALEKMHTDLEQEKLDLQRDIKNFQNLLSSKDGLLQQSQQHNTKLEVDLCAMKGEIKTLQDKLTTATIKVESLESVLAQTKLETDQILQSNQTLHAEISSLESAKRELYELKEQLHNQSEELKRENSRLLEDIENFKTDASSKEESLQQTQQRNETLHSQLNDLDEEVKSVRGLLNAKSTRVEDLESAIVQIKKEKEETLQSQLMSYQALERKHTDLGQEKLDLQRDIENFQNLLSSKDGLLQQSQQHNTKLEVDLCAMKGEIKTLQDELTTETIKVESLESVLAQTKLETDQILQSNQTLHAEISSLESAKRELYELKEQLHNQSEELKRENSRLLEDIENFKTDASSKEESLKQTQQRNETLHSQLNDLDEEVKSVRGLLNAKGTRVADLESTIVQIKKEKEETLQSQVMSYHSLEKKHLDLKQEKLDLLKDTENLKNSLLSTKILVQQSQQHITKLEFELCTMKDEIKTVQDELKTAISKVEGLECALAQSKLETDALIQSNESLQAEICSLESAKHDLYEVKEQLQKRGDELQEENSCFQAEIEKLKTNASLKEELLKQTQQQNETLDSKLNDLGEEVRSVKNLLSEKNARVKDLESLVAEIESEKKESFSIIQKLKLENVEHKSLIESCSVILTELVKRSSQLTSDEITDAGDLTILDLSKQLKTLINSLEVIHNTKDSDLKNFEATVTTLNSAVSELKTNIIHFEEMKIKNHLIISEYLKEITDLKKIAKEKENLLVDMDKLQKELSDERSKINLLNEQKKLLDRNVFDVKRSLILLKNEKSMLKQNVENQNRDLLTKIETISEVIAKMKDQVRLDNETILHLGEEKTLLASKYDGEKKLRTELETKCESLENENKSHTKEKKELKEKLNAIRVRNAKLEKNLDELRRENKKLETEKPSAEEQSEIEELKTSISKLQSQIKELETENIEKSKRPTEQDFNSRLKEVYIEYDQKLEKMKQKMKTAYNEQITKVNRDQERLMQEKLNAQRVKMEEQCRKHAEEITKYKDHVTKLSSDYWDVGEKLLVEKQQKEHVAQQLQDLRKRLQYERTAATKNVISQPLSAARSKTSSLDRREFVANTREETSAPRIVATIKEEVTPCSRRESIQSVQTMQGMGNAFKVEDEEGEIFNTNYLADMKAGRCSDAPDLERLSVLQLRNAQCKPHLKSSYPAETQFQPGTFTEEEIKSGSALEDIFNDSLSQSLLPGEKTKKRDRTQTLYKRPGPPTPSKNGGRLSLQGNESRSPNSRILRERNVERRSTATPRRLKDLFGSSSRRQDENVSGTPKGRRLSSIFRKPK